MRWTCGIQILSILIVYPRWVIEFGALPSILFVVSLISVTLKTKTDQDASAQGTDGQGPEFGGAALLRNAGIH